MKKLADPAGATIRWDLKFKGLTQAERAALEALFEGAEGRLQAFTFLDPTENLLLWSEDLSSSAWVKDPLITFTAGMADPTGAARATRISNTSPSGQSIRQSIAAPSWFQYCFSFYARSAGPATLTVYRSAGMTETSSTEEVGPNWRRIQHSGRLESTEELITFGIRLGPGTSIEVYGLQVEAQPGASTYRTTTSRCGVYANARFDGDRLTMTAEGPDAYSCSVRIVAVIAS